MNENRRGLVTDNHSIFSSLQKIFVQFIFDGINLCQIRNETPQLPKGAAEALYDLYEVVTHEFLSSDLRYSNHLSTLFDN